MDVTAGLTAPCSPVELFRWVEDLDRYPEWLDIVPATRPADRHADDPGPAWLVTLRGELGPLARAKRLRMVRTAHHPPAAVRFERMEHDGRAHAPWVLRAEVEAAAGTGPAGDDARSGSTLTVHLHYGGTLGGPQVRSLLEGAIERSRTRLLERVAGDVRL